MNDNELKQLIWDCWHNRKIKKLSDIAKIIGKSYSKTRQLLSECLAENRVQNLPEPITLPVNNKIAESDLIDDFNPEDVVGYGSKRNEAKFFIVMKGVVVYA